MGTFKERIADLGTIHLFRPASYLTSELYSSSATKDIITSPFNSVKNRKKHCEVQISLLL